eukprot:5339713-Prymnesium_polylepis.3
MGGRAALPVVWTARPAGTLGTAVLLAAGPTGRTAAAPVAAMRGAACASHLIDPALVARRDRCRRQQVLPERGRHALVDGAHPAEPAQRVEGTCLRERVGAGR